MDRRKWQGILGGGWGCMFTQTGFCNKRWGKASNQRCSTVFLRLLTGETLTTEAGGFTKYLKIHIQSPTPLTVGTLQWKASGRKTKYAQAYIQMAGGYQGCSNSLLVQRMSAKPMLLRAIWLLKSHPNYQTYLPSFCRCLSGTCREWRHFGVWLATYKVLVPRICPLEQRP